MPAGGRPRLAERREAGARRARGAGRGGRRRPPPGPAPPSQGHDRGAAVGGAAGDARAGNVWLSPGAPRPSQPKPPRAAPGGAVALAEGGARRVEPKPCASARRRHRRGGTRASRGWRSRSVRRGALAARLGPSFRSKSFSRESGGGGGRAGRNVWLNPGAPQGLRCRPRPAPHPRFAAGSVPQRSPRARSAMPCEGCHVSTRADRSAIAPAAGEGAGQGGEGASVVLPRAGRRTRRPDDMRASGAQIRSRAAHDARAAWLRARSRPPRPRCRHRRRGARGRYPAAPAGPRPTRRRQGEHRRARPLPAEATAGPSWPGRSGIHTHMTNTRITDPEV